MQRRVVVYIQFNDNDIDIRRQNPENPLSREWIAYRLKIFNKYTRQSLEAQTNQDFIAVLRIHPESESIVHEELQKYSPLRQNIIFSSSPKEVIIDYIKNAKELYLCQIDSDDLYRNDYIEQLHRFHCDRKIGGILSKVGFGYREESNILYYTNYGCPHFFTQIFSVEEYMRLYQYFPEIHHLYMIEFPLYITEGFQYLRIEHGKNISAWHIKSEFTSVVSDEAIKSYVRENFAFNEPM